MATARKIKGSLRTEMRQELKCFKGRLEQPQNSIPQNNRRKKRMNIRE
jgi:hypothetical protein